MTVPRCRIGAGVQEHYIAIWNGVVHDLQTDGDMAHRFGGEGHLVESYGSFAEPSPVQIVTFHETTAALRTYRTSLIALKNQVVSCVTGDGEEIEAVLVQRVTIQRVRRLPAGYATANAAGRVTRHQWRLEAELVLVRQPDPE